MWLFPEFPFNVFGYILLEYAILFILTIVASPLLMLTFSSDYRRQIFRNKLEFFAAAKVSSSFPPPNLPEIAFAGRIVNYLYISYHLDFFVLCFVDSLEFKPTFRRRV